MEWWTVALASNVVVSVALALVVVRTRRTLRHLRTEGDPAIAEEIRRRRREALDIHDNVVQGLAMAKLSLELGETETGMATLDATLGSARRLVTDLLGDPDIVDLRQGALRRTTPAGP